MLIMYLKKITRFWLAENECILMSHKCKVVKLVQISAHAFKVSSVLTFRDVFMYIINKK